MRRRLKRAAASCMDPKVKDGDPLEKILPSAPEERATSLSAQLDRYREALSQDEPSILRAARLGARSDRLGLGVAVAYYEATRARLGGSTFTSLAVTERGGAHPRAIESAAKRIDGGYALTGEKSFVTLGRHSESILILAKEGARADGRSELGLFRVPAAARELELSALPETPFTPELPHASVRFRSLHLSEDARLPGDGYADWVRDFGVVEEHHILAALLGYRAGLDRVYGGAPNQALEEALLGLLRLDPLSGTLSALLFIIDAAALLLRTPAEVLSRIPLEEAERYARDLRILQLGEGRRKKRLEMLRASASQAD